MDSKELQGLLDQFKSLNPDNQREAIYRSLLLLRLPSLKK